MPVATVDDINLDDDASTTAKSTIIKEVENVVDKGKEKIADMTGLPQWGVVAIFALVALLILGICGFCIRRFFKKRRTKDGKKGKGVDLKSVQLLGSAYKEKVSEQLETTRH